MLINPDKVKAKAKSKENGSIRMIPVRAAPD
jgi:hypothetical protein